MFSKYERTKDKRTYRDRQSLFTGPQYAYAAEKIKPSRQLRWSEEGLPEYVDLTTNSAEPATATEPEEEVTAQAEGEEE